MNRAYHNLTVRTLSEERRELQGWATTGRTDRVGDIVEPLGAEFDLPLPLLLDHNRTLAVGEVERAEVTSKGIRFVARIKKISEPGRAKELTDEAWDLAKAGLRRCVSIGFQPLDYEPLKDGGLRFTRWSWYELSLVTVGANSDAVIETVKRAPLRRQVRPAAKHPSVIIDEKQHLRRARAALTHFLGEAKVPRFTNIAALKRWDAMRLLEASTRGAIGLSYTDMMRAAPTTAPTPIVRIRQ